MNKYISKLTKILQMNYFKQLVEKDNGISSKSTKELIKLYKQYINLKL